LVTSLRAQFGDAVSAQLVAGGRGVFDVEAGGRRIFSKHQVHRFPDDGEVEARVAELLATP
jgi:Rdx family protein